MDQKRERRRFIGHSFPISRHQTISYRLCCWPIMAILFLLNLTPLLLQRDLGYYSNYYVYLCCFHNHRLR